MITLRSNSQRRHVQRGHQETWHSFFAVDREDAHGESFGALVGLDERRLPPGESTEPHVDNEAELITYVCRGALTQEDSVGNSGVIHAGEFQHMSPGCRIHHKETSVSRSDWLHMFRVSLRAAEMGIACQHEQKRFTTAQRRNLLCVVASPDGRQGSLRVHQDVLVCSAILEPGYHLVHALAVGRSAWLHVVRGEAALGELVLTRGDGVGVVDERAISLTVQETTELLLIDQGPATLRPWDRGSVTNPPGDERPAPAAPLQPGEGQGAEGVRS